MTLDELRREPHKPWPVEEAIDYEDPYTDAIFPGEELGWCTPPLRFGGQICQGWYNSFSKWYRIVLLKRFADHDEVFQSGVGWYFINMPPGFWGVMNPVWINKPTASAPLAKTTGITLGIPPSIVYPIEGFQPEDHAFSPALWRQQDFFEAETTILHEFDFSGEQPGGYIERGPFEYGPWSGGDYGGWSIQYYYTDLPPVPEAVYLLGCCDYGLGLLQLSPPIYTNQIDRYVFSPRIPSIMPVVSMLCHAFSGKRSHDRRIM